MESLYIKNFKNIRELTIDRLAKVNLIVGKNSVGKSTLLEALSVYLAQGDRFWLNELMDSRGELLMAKNDKDEESFNSQCYLSLFTGREENYSKDYSIEIGELDKDEEAVKINQVYIVREEEDALEGGTVLRTRVFSEENLEELTNVVERGLAVAYGNKKVIIPYRRLMSRMAVPYRLKFQYVHTVDFNTEKNAMLFDNISLSPEEKYIIQALQIIHPQITRINFLNMGYSTRYRKETRIPFVTMEGDKNKYLLSSMGDGINRILTIILAMLNCKGGTLLLDEFETGLHYSVQDELWKIIFMLAEELDVQVFATTHSNDCVNSFARINAKDKGMVIRLEERKGNIKAVIYTDPDELVFATANKIEIR